MIITQGRFCRVATVHFDEEPSSPLNADLINFVQRRTPVPGAVCTPYHTMVLDLRRDEESLLAAMNKGMRKDLRSAGRKGLDYQAWHGDRAVIAEALEFYDRFAALKRIAPADRQLVDALVTAGRLYVSTIRTGGEPLVWHFCYAWRERAVSLYSASFYRTFTDPAQRALVGIANRYHKWRDILMFKEAGFGVFDFGGWYEGTTDVEKLRINKYKEEFGGTPERNFNCLLPVTLKGRVALAARRLPLMIASVRERLPRRHGREADALPATPAS
jgi:hypothetical protein